MDNSSIDNLREAIRFSPDNIPLRMHLAASLEKLNRLEEAELEFQEVLKLANHSKAKLGLARIFFARDEFSKCNVILEELLAAGNPDFETLLLHTRALVKEEEISKAIDIYQQALELQPDFTDEELDRRLRVTSYDFEDADLDASDPKFLQKPTISFQDVGGMDQVKKEIDLKIVQPLKHPEIYKAYGKKIGGGILLYGPPGCGKTFLAKATAGQIKAKFINVSLNDILDMWIGNSEKNLHEVFEIARKNTPCVLFFDEIDALGASRSDMKHSGSRHLINQFLQELDGIDSNNDGVLVLGATNAPWHLDSAFRRPGRFDRIVFVPPPDQTAREAIFKLKLKEKPTDTVDCNSLSKKTTDFSGADIEAVIDISIEEKLENAILEGVPKPITTKDLQDAIKKHKPTTREWFTTAKNFALYSNESGLYDDILSYLKIKK
jgi:transitional endoplasmic reticulum ATPase